ncbi:MAG: hypothetical protein H6559_34995 [Lewinellaceae bacterium]|nr:hypothetical protein [Lewinellaceae bacterium]
MKKTATFCPYEYRPEKYFKEQIGRKAKGFLLGNDAKGCYSMVSPALQQLRSK